MGIEALGDCLTYRLYNMGRYPFPLYWSRSRGESGAWLLRGPLWQHEVISVGVQLVFYGEPDPIGVSIVVAVDRIRRGAHTLFPLDALPLFDPDFLLPPLRFTVSVALFSIVSKYALLWEPHHVCTVDWMWSCRPSSKSPLTRFSS